MREDPSFLREHGLAIGLLLEKSQYFVLDVYKYGFHR